MNALAFGVVDEFRQERLHSFMGIQQPWNSSHGMSINGMQKRELCITSNRGRSEQKPFVPVHDALSPKNAHTPVKSFALWGTLLIAGFLLLAAPNHLYAEPNHSRTWQMLTTGNGHGFQVYNRETGKIEQFLEHPYRFVAPTDTSRTEGIERRDLCQDIYFGARINGTSYWLTKSESVVYETQSHIIHTATIRDGVQFDIYFFSPFEYEGNALVMLIKATNKTDESLNLELFAKANMKLGIGRPEPDTNNEVITWYDEPFGHAIETGPGGGNLIYAPIPREYLVAKKECGQNSVLHDAVINGEDMNGDGNCHGLDDAVLVTQSTHLLEPGEADW